MRYIAMIMLAVAGAAAAQTPQATDAPPQRIRSVTLAPGETCPPSTGDEVIVCYQGGNPYRIPPALRRTEIPAANQSWANRAATVDQVSRVAGGLPNTCSPVGTGGQTGCFLQRNQAYGAERRERAREERIVPGGED